MPRDTCAICGAAINPVPVDGTDPDNAEKYWWEEYECRNGHSGRLEVTEPSEANGWQRRENHTGALRQEVESDG